MMAAYFFDASALVKRYLDELGTAWVRGITDPRMKNRIAISRISGVEVIAAIIRRQRSGAISDVDATQLLSDFRTDLAAQYRLTAVTPKLLASAMMLAELHGLRGYDAVQLAAAIRANAQRRARRGAALTLISADTELNTAAAAEGLTVDDPNAHP